MNLDGKWIALCCFLQTEKDRTEADLDPFSSEALEQEERDYERRQRETEYAWQEYLERDWEH